MTHVNLSRSCRFIVLAAVLIVAVPYTVHASTGATRALVQSGVVAPSPPLITFGQEGDSRHPLVVTIANTGAVAATSGVSPRTWTPRGRLSKDAIGGLMKLAQAEGFFTMPDAPAATTRLTHPGRFISIQTGATTKRVSVQLQRIVAFDQLYAVLLAATDVVGDAPPGELSPEAQTP